MDRYKPPAPIAGFVRTHFLTVSDVARAAVLCLSPQP